MTYREKYLKCETKEQLEKMVEDDVFTAVILGGNPDRIKVIKEEAEDVANIKFKEKE